MKCSVFIATSADGYIATPEGSVEWLFSSGNQDVDMTADDLGFTDYISSVDCMIMGRKCMEVIANMKLTQAQWPYGNRPIYVLSQSMTEVPENLPNTVKMYNGSILKLIAQLEQQGLKHAYIDGGLTISHFLNLKLINQMILTQAPILLGEGIPLFKGLQHRVSLSHAVTRAAANDFVQIAYEVSYPSFDES